MHLVLFQTCLLSEINFKAIIQSDWNVRSKFRSTRSYIQHGFFFITFNVRSQSLSVRGICAHNSQGLYYSVRIQMGISSVPDDSNLSCGYTKPSVKKSLRLREPIPMQIDKKSGGARGGRKGPGPRSRIGVWNSQEGRKDKHLFLPSPSLSHRKHFLLKL